MGQSETEKSKRFSRFLRCFDVSYFMGILFDESVAVAGMPGTF